MFLFDQDILTAKFRYHVATSSYTKPTHFALSLVVLQTFSVKEYRQF